MRKVFLKTSFALIIFLKTSTLLFSQMPMGRGELFSEMVLGGSWEINEGSYSGKKEIFLMSFPNEERRDLPTHMIFSGPISDTGSRVSFGGIIDFRYDLGLSYDYFQKNIPGKRISVKVFIPESTVSPFIYVPNRLRVTLKSEKNGIWSEYFEDTELVKVKNTGFYDFTFTVPSKTVTNAYGQSFDPRHIALLSVDLILMEGSKRHSAMYYFFSDVEVEGMDLDYGKVKWRMSVNGHISENMRLNTFPRNSISVNHIGKNVEVSFLQEKGLVVPKTFVGDRDELFLLVTCFIPEELKDHGGSIALKVTSKNNGLQKRYEKDMMSRDTNGKIAISLPLAHFRSGGNGALAKLVSGLGIEIQVDRGSADPNGSMPIVIEPPKLKRGELIPFDQEWKVRDVQGVGGYPFITKDPLMRIQPGSGITVKKFDHELYHLDLTVRLTGGIDWENPFYRVELLREFLEAKDLNDHEMEMVIVPVTDTTDLWQRPYRARIGLLDINDNVMLGPNISLSEGLPATAILEVSTGEPLPKGLVMPGFDPEKVKAVIINLEASHGKELYRDIKLSFRDLAIRPSPNRTRGHIKSIDFSRQVRDPDSWELTKLINSHGGYTLGINYPFPKVDVPASVMKVPLVYPSVGMKKNDKAHLGFSSELTKRTMIEDFTVFADLGLLIVRTFAFGGLEGVFEWDEKGKDIYFGEGKEDLVKTVSNMRVEDLAVYLNENGDSFLSQEGPGKYAGIEKHVLKDLIAFLDVHEIVEELTGKRLLSILSLYDFKLGEGVDREGPYHEFVVGEHPEVVTDPVTKVKAHALVWKLLKELTKDPRFYRYIGAIDVMNEPGNATALSTKQYFPDLVNFVGETIYLAKDAVGTSMPVSVGSRSWPLDLTYWRSIAEGVDILKPHYWESLESYNIDTPGLWPLDMPSDILWEIFGSQRDGRPTGIGEINPGENCKEKLLRIEKAGYGFTLLWSYSGHDGHDAKPLLPQVEEYQKGNIEFSTLSGISMENIEAAFDFITEEIRSFGQGDLSGRISEGSLVLSFKNFVFERAQEINDEDIKRAVLAISNTLYYKDMKIDAENIRFLRERARALSNVGVRF
jgi:hypothetical protein